MFAVGRRGDIQPPPQVQMLGDLYSIKKPRTMPGLKFAGDLGDQ